MPIYEYECSNCRYYLEVIQKISDAALKKCPSCGKSRLKKLISAPVFRLKGSGWYETDFKSDQDQKRNLAGAEKEEAASEAKDGKDDAAGKEKAAATEGAADAKAAPGDSKGESKGESKETPKAATADAGTGKTATRSKTGKSSKSSKSSKSRATRSSRPAPRRGAAAKAKSRRRGRR
jgi:putative FmdB family regulatory protein